MKKTLLSCLASLGVVGNICAQSTEELIKTQERDSAAPGQGVWWEWNTATDDWLGSRTILEDTGLDIFGGYTAEVWGNTAGGIKQGTVYTGLLDFAANLDLEKLVGWQGASVSTTWLWLSGRDASEDLTGNFLTISNIAGFNTLRMLELWFQQNLLDDKISLRLGQLTADSEFVISDYASTFINGTFGWPSFIYTNLPAGGPGYPMGTLGARLELNPSDWLSFKSAVFQGNVYDQDVNQHGFRWRLDRENGLLFLNEAQVRWNHREENTGLLGHAKAGMWIQTGQLADVLAESTNSGNYGWYFIIDQMLYIESSTESSVPLGAPRGGKSAVDFKGSESFKTPVVLEKSDQGLGSFARVAFTNEDRNFVSFYFDTGLTYRGLISTRDEDTLGVAFAYAQLGNTARNALIDEGSIGVGAEMVLEVTYQCQATPWLVVQPDLQYIINPGGTQDLGNALVIGGRVSVIF
jgi:porin